MLADVPAPHLYRSLVGTGHLSARLRQDLDRFQWDNATVKVELGGVRADPVAQAEAARRAGTVHLGGGLDDLTRCGADLATGSGARAAVRAVRPDDHDRPEPVAGRHRVGVGLRAPAARRRDAGGGRRASSARIEDEVERHAPGFRDLVLGPQRAELGRPGGRPTRRWTAARSTAVRRHCTSSWSSGPRPGSAAPDTPFPGLFLAGSSAHPGGGVHGACGANAARAALLRGRVGARLYDASVGAAQRFLSLSSRL